MKKLQTKKMIAKKTIALASASAIAVLATQALATQARADYVLDILHINDLHSRIEPINKYNSTCSAEDDQEGKCFGGIARVYTKINERRAALLKDKANVLVLDAGDQFQGSLFYSTYKGKAATQFMNQIGFDVMAVGNHEFDDGPKTLADFMDRVAFPVISGNTSVYYEPSLKNRMKGYAIIDKGGEKIGIVSVLATDTKETSSVGDNVHFVDTVRYLNSIVPEIQAKGVNKIIALTHVGLEEDKRIAAFVKGIDVIVGGHSHTLLSNTHPAAEDVYPVWVEQDGGVKVPIVQAYAYSKYVGEISVNFNDEGVVTAAYGEPHLLDAGTAPHKGIAAQVAKLGAPIEELKKQPVGMTSAAIDGDRNSCRLKECEMGNLVASAMLDHTKGQGVQIAIQNGGGLRASIDGGQITMGEVLTVLPFQNTLATFTLSGKDVVASLENGVSQTEEIKGRFPQVAGLRFAWNDDVKPMQGRVKQVQVMEGGKWVDIDTEKQYKVVSNNFMRAGGDGYAHFKHAGKNAYDYGPGLETVVADYLKANSPYKPVIHGNIVKGDGFADMEKTASVGGNYIIKPGDNLWSIAKAKYGDAMRWKDIRKANKQLVIRGLQIGDAITLP